MENKRIVRIVEFTIVFFLFGVLVQYILDMSGAVRAFYQWILSWSNINFNVVLDYLYASRLYHVCAWLIVAMASCLVGITAEEFYEMVID